MNKYTIALEQVEKIYHDCGLFNSEDFDKWADAYRLTQELFQWLDTPVTDEELVAYHDVKRIVDDIERSYTLASLKHKCLETYDELCNILAWCKRISLMRGKKCPGVDKYNPLPVKKKWMPLCDKAEEWRNYDIKLSQLDGKLYMYVFCRIVPKSDTRKYVFNGGHYTKTGRFLQKRYGE